MSETVFPGAAAQPAASTSNDEWSLPLYRVELVRERDVEMPSICAPKDAAAVAGKFLERSDREVFLVLLLATDNSLIGIHAAHTGTIAACVVGAREVFKVAILANAAAIIVAHNHPSGNLEPSREDIRITRQLAEAGRLMGVPVHDSLIVSHRGHTSLAERGLL